MSTGEPVYAVVPDTPAPARTGPATAGQQPGRGFGARHPSARASLANLSEADCASLGRAIEAIMQEYVAEYQKAQAGAAAAVLPTP